MTTIVITRDHNGLLTGAGEKDRQAYERLKKALKELEVGECLSLDVWFDRNRKLHGWHFIVLSAVFDAQDQFENQKMFRQWAQIGAGHCIYAPSSTGKMMAIAKSIDWNSMDDEEFKTHHETVVEFLRSVHATRFLWPMISDEEGAEMIDSILRRVEADRLRVLAERAAHDSA